MPNPFEEQTADAAPVVAPVTPEIKLDEPAAVTPVVVIDPAPQVNPETLGQKLFRVSTEGLEPLEIYAADESEAICRFVIATGIGDASRHQFRVAKV